MTAERFDPLRNRHRGWFDFVRDMSDPVDAPAVAVSADLLRVLERDRTMPIEALEALRTLQEGRDSEEGLARWAFHPLLRREGQRLSLTRPNPGGAGVSMVRELVDWRLASRVRQEADEAPIPFTMTSPVLWHEYMREEIPPLFGAVFNPGNWNSGIVRLGNDLILLTTLHKEGKRACSDYDDSFLSADRMTWQTQTQTRRDSRVGRILSGQEADAAVHLFVGAHRLRNCKAAPFLYCGQPMFESWEGDGPITITWLLTELVPAHLLKTLAVPVD